jgi:hypothetical protein
MGWTLNDIGPKPKLSFLATSHSIRMDQLFVATVDDLTAD